VLTALGVHAAGFAAARRCLRFLVETLFQIFCIALRYGMTVLNTFLPVDCRWHLQASEVSAVCVKWQGVDSMHPAAVYTDVVACRSGRQCRSTAGFSGRHPHRGLHRRLSLYERRVQPQSAVRQDVRLVLLQLFHVPAADGTQVTCHSPVGRRVRTLITALSRSVYTSSYARTAI